MKQIFDKTKYLAFLGMCFLLWSPKSWACNQIRKLGSSAADLTGMSQVIMDVEVWRNQPTTTCEYIVGISKGSSQNGSYNRFIQRNQVPIPLEFWNASMSQLIYDYPDAQPPENLIVGRFQTSGGANTQNEVLRLKLGPVPYNIGSGTYFNNFHLRMWVRPVGSQGVYSLVGTSNFEVRFNLAKSLDISLVSSGAPFDLVDTHENVQFGELTHNQVRSFDMLIGNNTAYRYSLSSTNNGKLLRSGGQISNLSDTVAYQFRIGNTAYSPQVLLGAGQFPFSSGAFNPGAGSVLRFPIEVKIVENPSQKNQGLYQDTIIIEVIAN